MNSPPGSPIIKSSTYITDVMDERTTSPPKSTTPPILSTTPPKLSSPTSKHTTLPAFESFQTTSPPKTPRRAIDITIPITPSDTPNFTGQPLMSINPDDIILDSDKTFFVLSTAHLRRTYTSKKTLEMPFLNMPKKDWRIRRDYQLDRLLAGIPYEDAGMEQLGYHLDPIKFDNFNYMLERLAKRVQERMNDTLSLPVWGTVNHPLDIWSASDFEVLSVLFRDDVETFLAFLHHNEVLFPSKGSIKEKEKFKDVKAERIIPKIHQVRGDRSISSFSTPEPRITQQRRISFKSPTLFEEKGFNAIRKSQAQTQYEPRVANTSGDDRRSNESDENDPARHDSRKRKGLFTSRKLSLTPVSPKEKEVQFDLKLKPDSVPKWNGDPDLLANWIIKLNNLADRSEKVFRQRGEIVPTRLEDEADAWFWCQSSQFRRNAMENWGTLRTAIASYFMNRSWLDKQKMRANRAHYREQGHSTESPTAYYIRKLGLLNLVYNLSDSEIMMEIMDGAPRFWSTIIDTQRCLNLVEFAATINYHEEVLQSSPLGTTDRTIERRLKNLELSIKPQSPQESRFTPRFDKFKARSNSIGFTPSMGKPPFPKDDSTVSKGTSPEKKGARPCRHCGSGKHWDNECKYARKAAKNARVNHINFDSDYEKAMDEYEEAYLNASSEEEEGPDMCSKPSVDATENVSREALHIKSFETTSESFASCLMLNAVKGTSDSSSEFSQKGLSNKRTKRKRLLNGIFKTSSFVGNICKGLTKDILSLPRIMSRPTGCSFLGAQATATKRWLGSYGLNESRIIIDSGANITLISQSCLVNMKNSPKIKKGQHVNLVQVTGASTISGYITLPIYFETNLGMIELIVDAYVVKGMTTPFILGNDFSDQYAISIIRNNEGATLQFGDSGHKIQVQTSVGSGISEEGQAFSIKSPTVIPTSESFTLKPRDSSVHAIANTIILPQTGKAVSVKLNFPVDSDTAYVEKMFISNRGEEEFYAIPDSLITKRNPMLYVSNFSNFPVQIHEGQVLGLDSTTRLPTSDALHEMPGEEEVSGGPKSSEISTEDIPSSALLDEVDLSKELSSDQLIKLRSVLLKNQEGLLRRTDSPAI
ncbi:hypothetical protein Clacol_010164 [Clathrus columnatus]|uniref:Peptidase A2 domain-containing protein n=1 Tax=Clathrus columnatus TaxID=1419009 RepID=A0AAV5AML1_9AGAM|nr:hypothetical protein Clacol_010164 [Clathrus columnatus]